MCLRARCNRSDELMKGNLVRFLITGNYTNTSEMPPSKCTSHVGHVITVIWFGLKHQYIKLIIITLRILNISAATEIAAVMGQIKKQ